MRFRQRNIILDALHNHLKFYPSPSILTYFWGLGSLAGLALLIQIITGIFLAVHYIPHANLAFLSLEHIMKNVNQGWFIRYVHSNGASMFFFVVYLHICRGLYYKSFKYELKEVWLSGIMIFVLMMATAFIGYVLPWGQMSYWGATVITNLFSAIPFFGNDLVFWLWGGFSVGSPTLTKFFSLHYLLPFVIITLVLIHIIQLHEVGSSNAFPLSFRLLNDNLFFYPYFFLKDLLGFFIFIFIFGCFISYAPDFLGHSDNYIQANERVTPEHIVPEWYFLPFYAVLRSIPNKMGGVLFMFGALIVLFLLPFLNNLKYLLKHSKLNKFLNTNYYFIHIFYLHKLLIFFFYICFIFLGWLGSKPAEYPFVIFGSYTTLVYFILILLLAVL